MPILKVWTSVRPGSLEPGERKGDSRLPYKYKWRDRSMTPTAKPEPPLCKSPLVERHSGRKIPRPDGLATCLNRGVIPFYSQSQFFDSYAFVQVTQTVCSHVEPRQRSLIFWRYSVRELPMTEPSCSRSFSSHNSNPSCANHSCPATKIAGSTRPWATKQSAVQFG